MIEFVIWSLNEITRVNPQNVTPSCPQLRLTLSLGFNVITIGESPDVAEIVVCDKKTPFEFENEVRAQSHDESIVTPQNIN